jgi:hypothetical protein
VIHRYDHEIRGATAVRPLVGIHGDGHGDGVVIAEPTDDFGFAIGIGVNPWYGVLDPEAMALATGVARLRRQHEQIADQLLDQEDLELDWECDNLWVGLTLHRGCWSLRFVLEGSAGRRSVEGGWDDAASQALALALEAMTSQLSAERSND